MRRSTFAVIPLVALALVSCGGGSDSDRSPTADIDPCSLITDADLTTVLGVVYLAEQGEPAGPFTNCSWGTGEVLVSIAPSETVITAPGEDECPSAEIGGESYACPGRVKFLIGGIHVTVSTISPTTEDMHLLALAERVLQKLRD